MRSSTKKLIITGTTILGMIGAYVIGLNKNASFNELHKDAQKVILNTADSVKAHIVKSNQALSVGDLNSAISEYEISVDLLKSIEKSAPSINTLEDKIASQEKFINIVQTVEKYFSMLNSKLEEIKQNRNKPAFVTINIQQSRLMYIGMRREYSALKVIISTESDKELAKAWAEFLSIWKNEALKKVDSWLESLRNLNLTEQNSKDYIDDLERFKKALKL